jgi:2-iminobutanoate/2-iminopropanoate deaminase
MMSRVKTLEPAGAIKPTGTWSLGARAGDFVFVAGMRGIDPATNTIVGPEEARVRQAYKNMKTIAESEGAKLTGCVRIVVYITDMGRLRPLVNKIQEEFWGGGPYPPRTIVESAASIRTTLSRWKAPSTPRNRPDFTPFALGVAGPSGLHILKARRRAGAKDEIPWASSSSSTTK